MAFGACNFPRETREIPCRLLIAVLVTIACFTATKPFRALAADQPPTSGQVLDDATPAPAAPSADNGLKDGGQSEDSSGKSPPEINDATARRVYEAYREAVFGYTLILAYMRNNPELTIYPGTNVDFSVEDYKEPDDTAFHAALAGPAKDLVTLELTPGLRISPFVLNWTVNYSSFEGGQTLQQRSDGTVASGRVQGDYLYGAGQLNQWLLWDSTWAPGALHTWAGWGVGWLRFDGDLDYSVGGSDYSGRIFSDGPKFHMVQTFGMELRIRQFFVAAEGFRMSANGTKPVKAQFSVNGQRLGDYYETFETRSYLIGYAFPL